MIHPDEHTLETLVLAPACIPADERAAIGEHLTACAGCRALHETILAVHRGLADGAGRPASALSRAVQRILGGAAVVRLTPYHPSPRTTTGGVYTGVLAAMAPDSTGREGFETVATFASEKDHILLRVRQDAAHNRVKLYYHADDPARMAGPVVTLPALAADAVIDDHGRSEFAIPAARSAREWSALEAFVAFPVCTVTRDAQGAVAAVNATGGMSASYRVRLTQDAEAMHLAWTAEEDAPEIRRAVLWTPDGRSLLVETSHGQASFPDPCPGERILIRLYT